MIATGIRRALPFAGRTTSAVARGPLLTAFLRANCAQPATPVMSIRPAQMTSPQPLRYNVERNGELPMQANDKAPDFTLLDENGNPVALKQFRGKPVVLFFFPKADTPG